MNEIEAIYQNQVFKPLEAVDLPENQRVRLNFQAIEVRDVRTWLQEVQERQRRIVEQRGYFPDSTSDIAEDRLR